MQKPTVKADGKRTAMSLPKSFARRQPMVMIVVGETSIGKTHRSILELYNYLQDDDVSGKKGRKILAFDVNGDDFPQFATVEPKYLNRISSVHARRILPLNQDGTPMNNQEKCDVVSLAGKTFRNGLLVLEDPDRYMAGSKSQDVIGLLTTNRHSGLDVMISHQSIAKISTTEWQNCTWIRMHHQVDDVSRYKNRIPNYFLVRIASFIVNQQYNQTTVALQRGEITPEQERRYRSFFVYVNMRKLQIRGCSKGAFIRATKKYIDMEEGKTIRNMMNERDSKDRLIYKNRQQAVLALIAKYLRYWQRSMV